MATYQRGKYW
jgi:integrase